MLRNSGTSPSREEHALVVDHDQRSVPLDHRPGCRQVERHDRDLLEVDVLPDVELGPVRQREHPHRLTLVPAHVVGAPELRALLLGVPTVLRRTDAEDALLGPRLLLVASGPTERRVEPPLVERLLEALRLPHVGVHRGSVVERVDAHRDAFGVLVDEQLHPRLGCHLLPHLVHRLELPGGVDVQERERRNRRVEGLAGQLEHDRAVLADRVQHHRSLALGDRLPHDLDAFGLEPLQVGERHGHAPVSGSSAAPGKPVDSCCVNIGLTLRYESESCLPLRRPLLVPPLPVPGGPAILGSTRPCCRRPRSSSRRSAIYS